MVHRNHNLIDKAQPIDEVESLLGGSMANNNPPDANAAIDAWLNVFTRLLHMPDSQRSAIRNELAEHLRERTRDLMLAGRTETESVRLAIEELGETIQLARRFESANRPHTRRWLMYASMLGFAAAVVITGAVVLTPDQQPQSLATVFQEQSATSTETERNLLQKEVDVPPDLPLVEVARVITKAAGAELVMSKAEFQQHGIDINDHFLELEMGRVPVSVALDRLARELSSEHVSIAWRADDRIIEIAAKEVLDARDSTLVSYNIGDIIQGVTKYGRKYDHAVGDITTLLHEIVEPKLWRGNGGSLAQLRVVGGRMFVQAPKRMHTQIEWILEQLRQDVSNVGADAQLVDPWGQPLLLGKQGAGDAEVRLRPGDHVTVSIFELHQPNEWAVITRKVDADGTYRVPELGEIEVTGLTRDEFEAQILKALKAKVMKNPKVDVVFDLAGG